MFETTATAAACLLLVAVLGSVGEAEEAGGGEREDRSGAGAAMLADIAQELVARSGTSTQVLSLNLTNLVILVVLKGLLMAAAMWGAKGGHHPHEPHPHPEHWQRARIPDPPSPTFLTEAELALLVAYLMGEGSSGGSGDACLLRVACEEPKKAREYVAAGRMAVKAAHILDKVVPVNPKYGRVLDEVTKATQLGADDGPAACRRAYKCGGTLADNRV